MMGNIGRWIKIQLILRYRQKQLPGEVRQRCFPVDFAKFVRTVLLQNTSGLQFLHGRYKEWLSDRL